MKKFIEKIAEQIKKSIKAETLLEVIVATAVFMIIMAPASSLYISNVKNSAMNKNDLIGAALAEEALEMVKNIRDTNLLKFSAKTDASGNNPCWNAKPDTPAKVLTIDDTQPATYCGNAVNQIGSALGPAYYTIGLDTTSIRNLGVPVPLPVVISSKHAALDPNNLVNGFRLSLDIIDEKTRPAPCLAGVNRQNCHDHFVDDTHLYTHDTSPPFSPFYRELNVVRMLDLDADPLTKEGMQVTATVVYMSGSKPRIIKRTMILTNRPPSI